MAFKRSGVRLPLSPPRISEPKGSFFLCVVEIRGTRTLLCQAQRVRRGSTNIVRRNNFRCRGFRRKTKLPVVQTGKRMRIFPLRGTETCLTLKADLRQSLKLAWIINTVYLFIFCFSSCWFRCKFLLCQSSKCSDLSNNFEKTSTPIPCVLSSGLSYISAIMPFFR